MGGARALADGRLDDAYRENHRAGELNGTVNGIAQRSLAAHAALWAGDIPALAAELAQLEATGFRTTGVSAARITMQAGLAATEKGKAEALGLYREALRRWHDLHLVLEEGLTAIDMATVLDPAEPEVQAAADAARSMFSRLGAKSFVERLDAALARKASAVEAAEPARSGDLSNV